MSPEVLKGDGYDFKSDIWSLGCLLYELAMLKSPFKSEGLNLYSLFQKISNGDFQPLPDNYSEELRSLVYGMISTRPQDRPEISYVCNVAQKMRTATSDKKQKSKNNILAGSSSTASLSAPNEAAQELNAVGETKDSERKETESKIIGIAAMEIEAVLEKKTAADSENIVTSERKKILLNRISAVDSKTDLKNDKVLHEVDANTRHYEQTSGDRKGGWKNSGVSNGFRNGNEKKDEGPTSTHSDLSDDETLPIEKGRKFSVGGEIDDRKFNRDGENDKYNGNASDLSRFGTNVDRETNYSSNRADDKQKVSTSNNFYGFDRSGSNKTRTETTIDNTTSYPDVVNTKEDTRPVIRRPKSANKNPGSDRPPKSTQSNGFATVGSNSDFNKPPLEKENSFNNSNNGFTSSTKRLDSATSRKKLADSLINASPAFAVMEDVYGKLVLLGFPMGNPGTSSKL